MANFSRVGGASEVMLEKTGLMMYFFSLKTRCSWTPRFTFQSGLRFHGYNISLVSTLF